MIYLYVKQHSVTGLKYFGKTVKNPLSYKGSGKYWLNHIRKHGVEHVVTVRVWSFVNEYDCRSFALTYSHTNNIVESKEWANMIVEDGVNTPPSHLLKGKSRPDHVREKIRQGHLGKKLSATHIENLRISHRGKKQCYEHIAKKVASRKGYRHSADTRQRISDGQRHRTMADAAKRHLSQMHQGKKWFNDGISSRQFFPEEVPEGWALGRLHRWKINKIESLAGK